jgi:isocitrate dehydrogenase kinase/phosphatase
MGGLERQESPARAGAERIYAAFRRFERAFQRVTALARRRFARREWHGIQADSQRRLDVYAETLDRLVADIRELLGEDVAEESLWRATRHAYADLLASEPNFELAQTFFNSLTRRLFSTVGVNPAIEFVGVASALGDPRTRPGMYRRYEPDGSLRDLLARLLRDCRLGAAWRDLEGDAGVAARRLGEHLTTSFGSPRLDAIETLEPVFYRNKGAYVIGRIRRDIRVLPFVLALVHDPEGIRVDALLLHQDEVSIVFSFTRSYFLVDVDCPRELIAFLKSIMPRKPIAELYTSLGFNKHGKTELYRSLLRHLAKHDDLFEIAPGDPGMVMLVFTLRGFDVVFKVIRDQFGPPKHTTPQEVMQRYRLVFKHDRVGRLIEAHEFEHLTFARERFSASLLDELLARASRRVELRDREVVIQHLYAERKVTPLNLHLLRVEQDEARRAVIDYGAAIKELAAANIFPGDFLLKNFGVTRHGRVVFYDYDELCLLEQVRFRELPVPRTPEEDLEPEPWFRVGDDDVFPEEFRRFLGLKGPLRQTFERHHGDLFTVEFWNGLRERHRRGELVDVFPYPDARRLGSRGGDVRDGAEDTA